MKIGTRVKDSNGFTGTIAGEPKINAEHYWEYPIKWDDTNKIEGAWDFTVIAAEIETKALNFEVLARSAGWSALARNGQQEGVSIVSATNQISKNEIVLKFVNGRYDYAGSYATKSGRKVKVRNVSEARRLIGTL